MRRLSLFILAAALSGGCAAIQPGAAESTYDQALLNATYYGAYYRPVAESSERPERDRRETTPRRDREDRQETAPTTEPVQVASAPPPQVNGAIPEATTPSSSRSTPSDAAAYVEAVYALNETPVTESGASPTIVNMYRHADSTGTVYHATTPAIGDIAFFHNTSDRNGDGRNNDWYAHVGIVESVDSAGTISVLSYLDGEVSRIYMNLEHASDIELDGTRINSELRAARESDPEYTRYLAGELFAGFGSLLGSRTEVVVLDSWSPDSTSMTASR